VSAPRSEFAVEDDPAKVPKLEVLVRNPDGEVVYRTWQEAVSRWQNCFLRFGVEERDLLGETIDGSWWDVPDPIEQYTRAQVLERITAALATEDETAYRLVRNKLGLEAAEVLRRVLDSQPER
jgi:hypothetical protein